MAARILAQAPSAQALDEEQRALRSSLIASQLMGLAFVRFIWKIEPLASLDDEAVVAAIAPAIQRYLDDDLGRASAPAAGTAKSSRRATASTRRRKS